MKHVYVLLVCAVAFMAGCQRAPQPLVIDDFEGTLSKETVDFGSSEGSTVSVSAAADITSCGKQSMKIEYELKPSGYMWIARGYGLDVAGAGQWLEKPDQIKWGSFNAIRIMMYGSGQGGVVAFDLKDAGGEMWRSLLDDDTKGWKEITCPFAGFFPRKDWQPDTAVKNDILDFPIKSYQLEPRLPGKGVYYFDCVTLVKVKSKK